MKPRDAAFAEKHERMRDVRKANGDGGFEGGTRRVAPISARCASRAKRIDVGNLPMSACFSRAIATNRPPGDGIERQQPGYRRQPADVPGRRKDDKKPAELKAVRVFGITQAIAAGHRGRYCGTA